MGYYRLIGISPNADDATVRSACLRLLKQSHPDRGGSAEAFMQAKKVYDALKDSKARRAYDLVSKEPSKKVGMGDVIIREVRQEAEGWRFYKEPAFLPMKDDIENVLAWRALIESRAKKFHVSIVFDVGIVEDGSDFQIQDDIALIKKDVKPRIYAASAYVLERITRA